MQVDGACQGNAYVKGTMKLGSKSTFKGRLVAPTFVAANGAAFEGYCKIGRRKAA